MLGIATALLGTWWILVWLAYNSMPMPDSLYGQTADRQIDFYKDRFDSMELALWAGTVGQFIAICIQILGWLGIITTSISFRKKTSSPSKETSPVEGEIQNKESEFKP